MERHDNGSVPEKPDRKTIERNRRIQMKGLCFKLISLIPRNHFKPSKEFLSLPEQIDQATSYIQQLRERVDRLRQRKEMMALKNGGTAGASSSSNSRNTGKKGRQELPIFKLREMGSNLEVILITGLRNNYLILHQIIGILDEEGAEVISANFSTVGDTVYHTLHAQVKVTRVGVDTSRIGERLQWLIS